MIPSSAKQSGHGTVWRDSLFRRPDSRILVISSDTSLLLELQADDEITLRDFEGGQEFWLALPGKEALRTDIDVSESAPHPADEEHSTAFLSCLKASHADWLRSVGGDPLLLVANGPVCHIRAKRKVSIAIASLSTASNPLPAGEIHAVFRPKSKREAGSFDLPDPLADMNSDDTVLASSGHAYRVKKGEYIQIIDGQGRQCSDFLAFSEAALERGAERFIDSAATRSMVRAAYPQPGLSNKFYDQDLEPLVEIVQDTCGRHDTFGQACTARTYHLQGYPEHNNCSDNITAEMAPYGVAARASWPAINFFYNTELARDNVLRSDDGWSRPGDYVLLRALKDLVCVSTACADDLSPINGWNPTDIQVRTYDKKHEFDSQMAYRKSMWSAPVMTRNTPFHEATSKLTRHYAAAREFWVPERFSGLGPVSEFWATRDAATIQDLSMLCKFDIAGPDAAALANFAMPRDIMRMDVGQAFYSPICRDHGGVMDDGVLFRLGPALFRWTGGNPLAGDWLREIAEKNGYQAAVRETTGRLCNLSVQGPRSLDILKPLFAGPDREPRLEELKRFRFSHTRLGGLAGPSMLVSRTGYTGLPGYEVFCAPQDALKAWDTIMDAGEPLGLQPMGLEGLELCRIEAGLPSLGAELSEEHTPVESGLGFTVPLDKKSADFIGRAACEAAAKLPRSRIVGIDLEGEHVPQPGSAVFQGQTKLGTVTSACLSPHKGHAHGMARLVGLSAEHGTEVEIGQLDNEMKRLRATVRIK